MTRRDFVIGATAATGLTAALHRMGASARRREARADCRDDVRPEHHREDNMPPGPARTLDIMDIGQLCADRYRRPPSRAAEQLLSVDRDVVAPGLQDATRTDADEGRPDQLGVRRGSDHGGRLADRDDCR